MHSKRMTSAGLDAAILIQSIGLGVAVGLSPLIGLHAYVRLPHPNAAAEYDLPPLSMVFLSQLVGTGQTTIECVAKDTQC